jgi:hypothetical protein
MTLFSCVYACLLSYTYVNKYRNVPERLLYCILENMHSKDTRPKILKKIFPGKELFGFCLNFHIHVPESDLYIYSHDRSAYSSAGKYVWTDSRNI